jgi:RNA 2',3'-cyclic 3'-phosphodiesterase
MLSSFSVITDRVFIAISLPDKIHDNLSVINAKLRRDLPDGMIRWVKVENIHLTLKFLGEIPKADADRLKTNLESPVGCHLPFELSVEGIGVFPNLHRPRIVWTGVRDSSELIRLQDAVERITQEMGYAAEERKFSAHLTLGRVNQSINPQQLQLCSKVISNSSVGGMGSFIVKSIDIYRSDLNAGGSIYTRLHSIPLKMEF